MKKYVVVDTNVLVSALITRNESSPTVQILRYISENKIIPVYSEEIIIEYQEVLHREKFKLPDKIIEGLLKDIVSNGFEVKRDRNSRRKNARSKRYCFLRSNIDNL